MPPEQPACPPREDESLFERMGLDRLSLAAIGVSFGGVTPAQVEATRLYALHADYGALAERWRVTFVASYWGSRYTDETTQRFADSLRAQIVDPSGDDTLDVGTIRVSDITLGADLRWFPLAGRNTFLRPYAGGGLAAHVINAEGRFIAGTLMERALDDIATGTVAVVGVDAVLARRLSAGAQLRYDLVSGTRFASLRVGATYHFDAQTVRRRPSPEPVR
ncbi:MAG: outer membrane protein [Gemmatimonadaceae bacterium]